MLRSPGPYRILFQEGALRTEPQAHQRGKHQKPEEDMTENENIRMQSTIKGIGKYAALPNLSFLADGYMWLV